MKKNPEFQYCFFDKDSCAFDRKSLSREYFADSFISVDQLLSDIEEQCEFYKKYKKSRKIARIFEWILGTVIPLAMLSSILGIMFEINVLLWVSAVCLILFIILVLVVKIVIYRKVAKLFKYYDNIAKTIISIYNSKLFHSKGFHITYKTNNVHLENDEKNKLFWIEFYKISKVFANDRKNEKAESFFLLNVDKGKELSSIIMNSFMSRKNRQQSVEMEDESLKLPILRDEK